MQTVVFFLIFFLALPLFLASLRFLIAFFSGPRDASAYSRQMYREMIRRSVVELVIGYLITILASCALVRLLR